MAKQPSLGRVKTRLSRDIGAAEALRFYRTTLARTSRRLSSDKRWHTVLALAPDTARPGPGLTAAPVIGQGRGDLGQRMQFLFDQVPGGAMVLIGADIPGVRPHMIAAAFQQLRGHDAVFGPALDGGYWLIGQQRARQVLRPFKNIRWSSPHALADTTANLKGCRVAYVDHLQDVDRGADLVASVKEV
jgi:rSAM/selenodomain-associated transferase 1